MSSHFCILQKLFSLNNAFIKTLHWAAFEIKYFLPAFPEVTLISQYEYYCATTEQLLCLNDVHWFISFFIKLDLEYCLGKRSGVASQVDGL